MRLVLLTHSLVSDWNHGKAHFQRGILTEMQRRGHEVLALEPEDGWSRRNLVAEHGESAVQAFHEDFPELPVAQYSETEAVDAAVEGADVVIVHEWTEPAIVAHLGRRRANGAPFTLLFNDTHHRAISSPEEMEELDLDGYDAVLSFGEILSETYRRRGWGRRVITWHEAADTTRFAPRPHIRPSGDLVWIGNWGDGERERELLDYLIEPVRRLCLSANVHGVRYTAKALSLLETAGIRYRGWLPNAAVPDAFAQHRCTVHVPRRHYADRLPGIPTIRMFEALACRIPLVSAPWLDVEGLFRIGEDYLFAPSGDCMQALIERLLIDEAFAAEIARNGRETVLARHTCAHRVDELLAHLATISPQKFAAPETEVA